MGSIRIAASFLVGLLLLVGLFAVVQHYAVQLSGVVFDPEDGFAAQFAKYKQHSSMEFLHLAPAFIFFSIIPLQFVGRIRANHPLVHRVLGRTCVVVGVTSGMLGLIIAVVMPFGGFLETVVVLPFGIFFLFALTQGYLNARARRIVQHRAWMIRALAVALAISLQRVYLGLLMIDAPMSEMPQMFNVALALGFCTTIGLAELYVRHVPLRRPNTASPELKTIAGSKTQKLVLEPINRAKNNATQMGSLSK